MKAEIIKLETSAIGFKNYFPPTKTDSSIFHSVQKLKVHSNFST